MSLLDKIFDEQTRTRRAREALIDHLVNEHGAWDGFAPFPPLAQLRVRHTESHQPVLSHVKSNAGSHKHTGRELWNR